MVAQINGSYFSASRAKSLTRLISYALIEGRPLTTKGRWINPLVFAQFFFIKLLPQLKQVRQPLYIMGTGRSGSTFLGNALSLHPDICYLNEPKALWHSVYPYEDVLGNYTDSPARFRLESGDVTDKIVCNARKLYAYALAITGSSRILDKHGELIFRASFIKKIFPDARFIFLVRNGNDTVSSVARWSESKRSASATGISDWWGVDDRKWKLLLDELVADDDELGEGYQELCRIESQEDKAAVEWIMTMKEGLKLLKDFPDSSKMIRYEDILSTPDKAMDEIFDFANLEPSDRVRQYALETLKSPHKHDGFKLSPMVDEAFKKALQTMGY